MTNSTNTPVAGRPSFTVHAGSAPAGSLMEAWATRLALTAAVAWTFVASSGPIQWMDNGYLVFLAAHSDYFTLSLSATSHPLYHLLTVVLYQVFGLYSVAYLNSLLMVPIAYVVYQLSKALGINWQYAMFASIAVVLLHNVFWVSTKIEVYALHLLIVLSAYWIVLDEVFIKKDRSRTLLLGLLTGLGAATHQLTFIVLLPLYVYAARRFGWSIAFVLPGFALGVFSCYPAILNQLSSGSALFTVIRMFLTGSDGASAPGYEGAFLRFDRIVQDKSYAALVLLSLCGIGVFGLFQIPRTIQHQILWSAATLDLLFSMSYGVSDRFTFFLPGAAMYTILGVAFMDRRDAKYRLTGHATLAIIVAHPLILMSVLAMADRGMLIVPTQTAKMPYRNEIQYFISPYIPDKSAETFALAYERQVPEGSVVLSDYSPMGALVSAQIAGHFLHRQLIQCDEEHQAWPHTMYLVRRDYCDRVIEGYSIESAAIGWLVRR